MIFSCLEAKILLKRHILQQKKILAPIFSLPLHNLHYSSRFYFTCDCDTGMQCDVFCDMIFTSFLVMSAAKDESIISPWTWLAFLLLSQLKLVVTFAVAVWSCPRSCSLHASIVHSSVTTFLQDTYADQEEVERTIMLTMMRRKER